MEDEVFNLDDLNLEESTFNEIMGNQIAPEDKTETGEEQETQNEEVVTSENSSTEKEIPEKTPSSNTQEDLSTFSVFANLLKEEGVLSAEDEEINSIKNAEDLVNVFKKTLEDTKYSGLTDTQKRYLEAVEAGIPNNEFEKLEKQLNSLASINEDTINSNEQARFDLIAYDYINQGLSKEKAIELANRSIKLGTDVEDSKEALQNLIKVKNEEYKELLSAKKEENKLSLEKVKERIYAKDSILKDIKLNDKLKSEIYDLVTVKVDSDESGNPLNELNKWRKDNGVEADIILGAIYKLTNGFKDLGKITTVAKSNSAQELERRLRQNDMSDLNKSISVGGNNFEINI